MSILFVAECDLGGWGYQNSSYYPSTKSQTRGTGFQRLGRGELRLFFVQEGGEWMRKDDTLLSDVLKVEQSHKQLLFDFGRSFVGMVQGLRRVITCLRVMNMDALLNFADLSNVTVGHFVPNMDLLFVSTVSQLWLRTLRCKQSVYARLRENWINCYSPRLKFALLQER